MPETDARARILACAEELFGRRGYEAVAVSDISDASEVSTGLVYYHFKDKFSLLSALVEEIGSMTDGLAEEHLDGDGDPRSRVESFIQAYMRLIDERRDLVRLLSRQVTDVGNPAGRTALDHMSHTIDHLARVISEGTRSGDFGEVDPRLAAESVFGMLHIRVVADALEAPHSAAVDVGPEDIARFVSQVLMDGIGR